MAKAATAKAERLLALAEFVGVDLGALEAARRRLAKHEAEYERTLGSPKRKELEQLVVLDVAELAEGFKRLAAVVEQGGAA